MDSILKTIKDLFSKKPKTLEDLNLKEREETLEEQVLYRDLEKNIDHIESLLGGSYDLQIRRFRSGVEKIPLAALSIAGLSDNKRLDSLMNDLTTEILKTKIPVKNPEHLFQVATNQILKNEKVTTSNQLVTILDHLLTGETLFLIQGLKESIICDSKSWPNRNVAEPESETVIRGPRDGFIESVITNTALIRRRIRSPNLWMEGLEIGKITKTKIVIAYLKGLASEDLIGEIRKRLEGIEIDGIFESGQIEELIEDTPYTIFPLMQRTERTDVAISNILEGRALLLIDGTPFALVIPMNFTDMLQAPDDYYEKFPIGFFIRILRHIAYLLSIFLPGSYVAIINFHHELLPTSLLLRITSTRQGVPFPVAMEVFVMEFLFEILREAGLRLPRMIGPAISIVGALILGDAAIRAGIVSPAVVIVIALTAIASFSTPVFSMSIAGRLIRFFIIALGGIFGLFGIQFAFLLLGIHLCSLRSFGNPYFAPIGPMILDDWKDMVFRTPWYNMRRRPKIIAGQDPVRQKKREEFTPPQGLDDEGDDV